MTREHAAALRAAAGADVAVLSRKSRHELAAIWQSELAARNTESLFGGPRTKQELIGAISELRYPIARQNEATHVLGHQPGERWSACEFCQCQTTWRYRKPGSPLEYIAQCTGQPGHHGDHADADHTEAGTFAGGQS